MLIPLSLLLAAALAAAPAPATDNLALGIPGPSDQLVDRVGYALGYSERDEQPLWVAYRLTPDEATNAAVRRAGHRFAPDPAIATGSATLADYARSGFDRGHLAPAADMRFSPQTMADSFLLSNMSPQLPAFNRGVWKRLEDHIRVLAAQGATLDIVTGPVFFTNTPARVLGPSRIRIPDAFYKVVYVETTPPTMLAFLVPHVATDAPLTTFSTNVAAIESMTGLDFFAALPDALETNLESVVATPPRFLLYCAPTTQHYKGDRP